MAPLRNQRHENFCHQIIEAARFGRTQGQAYSRAGFKADGASAEANASRLLTDANIQARIAELGRPTARRTRATVDTLAAQLDEVFAGASGDKQWGAAGSATALKAKLLGFMRDKLELGGPGDFAVAETPDEVVDRMIEDWGAQEALRVADLIKRLIEERVAGAAFDVTPPAKRWSSMPERRRGLG
ncbi:terminase small subunit [Bradyrhizobium sp. 956_D2_N1_5]|uniref:terminase small subunit n=1 Tax=unclassified Bradyrhizobium TaxID=2631580 RepID=UPI003F25CA18